MSFKLRRAIKLAAAEPDITAAIATLERVPRWRELATGDRAELSSKERRRLVGVCIRGGLFDDALAILSAGAIERMPAAEAIVLDPQYDGPGGHHHQFGQFYLDLIAAAGMTGTFVHPNRRQPSPADALPGAAVLANIPADFKLFPLGVGAAELAALNRLYELSFLRGLPDRRPRLIVVPTATYMSVDGLAGYISATPGESTLLLLELHDPFWVEAEGDIRVELFRTALGKLRSTDGVELLIVGETPPIADGFLRALGPGWNVVSGSAYMAPMAIEPRATRRANQRPVLGYAGRSAADRGVGLIADIVQATLCAGFDLTWNIQIKPRRNPDPDVVAVGEALADVPSERLAFAPRRLEPTEYAELLHAIDIMVMPFSDDYRARSSGLAPECLRHGIVMVVPFGSTMAHLAENHGAGYVTFSELTTDAVTEAIGQAIDRLPELRQRSADAMANVEESESLRRVVAFIEAA